MTSAKTPLAQARSPRAPVPATPPPSDKLATRIAEALEQEIIATGWNIGQALGNEEQLVKRFGVSRWVLREALAITERDGLTQMRRGRNGGLVVSAPADSVVETTMRNYLLFTPIDIGELLSIRRLIDSISCSQAATECSAEQIAASRRLLADVAVKENLGALRHSSEIYRQIQSLAGNRFIKIFGHMLSQLTYGLGICIGSPHFFGDTVTGLSRRMMDIRHRQLECIIAADTFGAVQAAGAACDTLLAMFRDSPHRGERFCLGDSSAHTLPIAQQIVDAFPSERRQRRVDTLILQLQLDVRRLQLNPGHPIAPESVLMAHYGVGRNVLREAIRSLQRDHFVTAVEGRQGGLCVATPVPDAVVRSNMLYFQFMQVTPQEIAVILPEIRLLAVELAASRVGREGSDCIDPVSNALRRMETAKPGALAAHVSEFFLALACACGNPIIDLIMRTVDGLCRANPGAASLSKQPPNRKQLVSRLAQLEGALRGGDTQLSRRYLKEMLSTG
jgi:DNA-binding FadR family transcriptional regulator